MARALCILFVALIIVVSSGPAGPALAQEEARVSPEPIVVRADEEGLRLEWQLPPYRLGEVVVDGLWYSQVQLADLASSDRPGYPQLPTYRRFVGLPPAGEASIRIVKVEQETVTLPYLPLPAPTPQAVHLSLIQPADLPEVGPTIRLPDPMGYRSDALYPDSIAWLEAPQQARGQRVARLVINPIQVNPVKREMSIVRELHLEITFSQPVSTAALSRNQQAPLDPYEHALASILLNPQATAWATEAGQPSSARSLREPSLSTETSDKLTKVLVTEPALYRLTYADLQDVGLPVATLDPRTLKLSHGYPRQEVAIVVEGEADGLFDSQDRILFYAAPDFSRYVDYDVYFLTYGGPNGLRMSPRSGDPTGLPSANAWRKAIAEENRFYDSLYAGRDGDRWFWDNLRQPNQTVADYTIMLDEPQRTGPQGNLTIWLQGYTTDRNLTPDHRVGVSFQGQMLSEMIWDGDQAFTASFPVPGNWLQAGDNPLTLSLPGTGSILEGVWVDAFELIYPTERASTGQLLFEGETGRNSYTIGGWAGRPLMVYEISQAEHPRRVVNYHYDGNILTLGDAEATLAHYLVVPEDQLKQPAALTPFHTFSDPVAGADYIIITPPDFAGAIAPLAAHRAAQGLRVVTVDVRAIYDNFGQGRLHPQAIQTFLKHAYQTWAAPAPLYVLLVGDGSYDLKNYSGWEPQTFIPPFLAEVDPRLGETAADNRFVTVAGDDILPDLLLGRLAVTSPAEATTVVNKIITYETDPQPGDWNGRHLFVTDNPDYAGDFHRSADEAYNTVSSPRTGYRFYYSDVLSLDPYIYTDVEALRTAFLTHFQAGAGIITFHGHSSWHQWASESLFRWNAKPELNDVIALTNGERLPLVLEMTCFTGYFHHPEYPTLDESLLRQAGGGAIAVWGSSGLGVATGHNTLQEHIYSRLVDQEQTNLGAILLASKLALSETGFNLDLVDTYLLFGDPALTLNLNVVSFKEHIYLPFISR